VGLQPVDSRTARNVWLPLLVQLMGDIRPYGHPRHGIVELPVHWTFDDAPHFWFDLRA